MNMKSKNNVLIKISAWSSIIAYILLVSFKKPSTGVGFISLIPEAVGIPPIPILIFDKWLWKWIPFIKMPKLKKEYIGTLKYNFDGEDLNKNIKVFVEQTFTNIKIKLKTNEVISNSIVAEIIEENGDFILYYNYRTNPYSKYSDSNPIQIGTCRLDVSNPKNINGTYWTNRKTNGDIFLE